MQLHGNMNAFLEIMSTPYGNSASVEQRLRMIWVFEYKQSPEIYFLSDFLLFLG